MVIPARVTIPASTSNTRKASVCLASLRITVSLSAPGPSTVRFWSMTSVLDRTMVAGSLSAKLMVSPEAELAMAWRREPGPSSWTLITVRTVCRPLGVMARAVRDCAVAALVAGGRHSRRHKIGAGGSSPKAQRGGGGTQDKRNKSLHTISDLLVEQLGLDDTRSCEPGSARVSAVQLIIIQC